MASLLAKKLTRAFHFLTSRSHLTLPSLLRLVSTESPQPNTPPFMAQYLISSFGFSPDRALRLATTSHFCPIQTSDRPEAVVRFLKETGFTDPQINKLITWEPQLLRRSVSKTLEPNLHNVMAVGVTGQKLVRLIQFSPSILWTKSAAARVQFWRDYMGNDDAFLKTIHRNHRLLQLDIDKVVMPNMKLLRDYGFSDAEVRKVWFLVGDKLTNVDSTKKLLDKTTALGFAPRSGMFLCALPVVAMLKGETINSVLQKFLRKGTERKRKEEERFLLHPKFGGTKSANFVKEQSLHYPPLHSISIQIFRFWSKEQSLGRQGQLCLPFPFRRVSSSGADP